MECFRCTLDDHDGDYECESKDNKMNGNVYDIGQTINGVSRFLFFNYKWYYFVEGFTNEYEYDQQDLTKLVTENEFNEVNLLGNIFEILN
jgi:hypothetical protein